MVEKIILNGEYRRVNQKLIWMLPLAVGLITGCNQGGGGGGAGDSTVAVVNGAEVSEKDFHSYLERKRTVQVATPDGQIATLQVAGLLGLQGLQDMVNREILIQIAKDQNVMPDDAAIKKELDYQTKRDPQFVKRLNTAGLSLDQIKRDLSLDLARFNVVTKGITVTPKDVDDFIKSTPKAFETPAAVDLYWIVLNDPKNKAAVDADLKAGQQFPVVAGRYSVDPAAKTSSGQYPRRQENQLPPKLQELVKNMKPGTASQWLQDGNNSLKFFLQSRTPAGKIKIDDTIREAVRRQLAEQRGSQGNDLNKTLRDRLKTAKVEIKIPYMKEGWKSLMEALKQQDASAPAPGTGTGG